MERTRRRRLLEYRYALWATLFALALGACGPGDGDEESEKLAFTGVTVTSARATPGDVIEVRWGYEDEHLLKEQWIELRILLLQGIATQPYTLREDLRSFAFEFASPVTVELFARDTDDAVINLAFDILLDEEYFFRAEVSSTNPQYPRLGYTLGASRQTLEFTTILGIWEVLDASYEEDGVIDDLAGRPLIAAALPPGKSFLARSTRPEEAQHFGFEQGSGFPWLDSGFLATEEGLQFLGVQRGDFVIFGGKIAYDGRVTEVKGADGTQIVARTGITHREPVFLCLDGRTDDVGTPYIADAHIGNLAQGLVLSCFASFQAIGRTLGSYTVEYSFPNLDGAYVGTISGTLNTGRLGAQIVPPGGVITSLYVDLLKVDWNLPFYPDFDIGLGTRVFFN